MGSGGHEDVSAAAPDIVTATQIGRISRATKSVDIVYGLHPNTSTGGCVVQRSFEDSLRAAGVQSIRAHVASTPESAEQVFQSLRRQEEETDLGSHSRVLIVDGIALLFLREKMHELRSLFGIEHGTAAGVPRALIGFIHCPFSEVFYREEPWLKAALPEDMLACADRLRDEETRLFGLLDRIIVVGDPCRSLLVSKHSVPATSVLLLEPTIPAPRPGILQSLPGEATAALHGRNIDEGSSFRFVSVGTLCPRKGQLELVAALKAACVAYPEELGGSTLTLIGGQGGDPDYAAKVLAAATKSFSDSSDSSTNTDGGCDTNSRRLEVLLLGSLPHEETLDCVAASDAFLLNSSLESWAVAPVEAALRGVPIITTRVGALSESLPPKSTIWVGGRKGVRNGVDASASSTAGHDCALASSTDWKEALRQFARDRKRLKSEASSAVPTLLERFGPVAMKSRHRAIQEIFKTADFSGPSAAATLSPSCQKGVPSFRQERHPSAGEGRGHSKGKSASSSNGPGLLSGSRLSNNSGKSIATQCYHDSTSLARSNTSLRGGISGCASGDGLGTSSDPLMFNGSVICDGAKFSAAAAADVAEEEERVRRVTVIHAFACVCVTCFSMCCFSGEAAGTLVALVAAQALFFLNLSPTLSPANVVTIVRSLIPPAVVWWKAGADFGQVSMADVSVFGVAFVLLDMVDGALARRSKAGPTRVGAALDVESDSIAVLFLSLAASRKAWYGGFVAGILRYVFVLATGARELPPSPIGPAGRWFAKVAALASVAALAFSIGSGGEGVPRHTGGEARAGGPGGASPFLCAAGVAVLCASFSVDFYQIWVILPREASRGDPSNEAPKELASSVSTGGAMICPAAQMAIDEKREQIAPFVG